MIHEAMRGSPPVMARKLRVEHQGAIYYVMNRDDRREPILQFGQNSFKALADSANYINV